MHTTGTGKTATIKMLLSVLATWAPRRSVLMAAPTNVAVAEVATRFVTSVLHVSVRCNTMYFSVFLLKNHHAL